MIQLKNFKRDIFKNADKYWKENNKDRITISGFELQIGTRLRAIVTNDGKQRKFYLMIISLEPATIAYWIEGEFCVYLAPIDFDQLFTKREIPKRTMKDKSIKPQNFRYFSAKAVNASTVKTILAHLPRLSPLDVKANPNTLAIKTPKLIYDFCMYMTAAKEPIFDWMLKLAVHCNDAYHTGVRESELSDDQFDELKEFLLEKDSSKAKILDKVGTGVKLKTTKVSVGEEKGVKTKVKLEHKMGSMVKIKPDGVSTSKFLTDTKDTHYVVSDKLDGISLSIKYVDGKLVQATTRGDGEVGQLVTKHVLAVPTVPKDIGRKYKGSWTVRAEGILSNSDFEKLKSTNKGNKDFANPRNMIAGTFNRLIPDTKVLAKLNVVAYSVMSHEHIMDKADQLMAIKDMGFHVVNHKLLASKLINDKKLTEYINERKAIGDFDLDGAVVEANNVKIRKSLGTETNSINPRYARAFKTGETETVEATILDVEWQPSKHGYLKPRIKIKPVKLGGVTVTYATAFNGAFVRDNRLGTGAKVLLTRSGDVIPHILRVITRANKAQLPSVEEFGAWDWNNTNVDIVLSDPTENSTVKVKQITEFFKTIGVDFLGQGLIQRFYESGYDDIDKMINITIPDLLNIDGIQKKSAEKLYEGINNALTNIELPTLASATPYFGTNFGSTRLEKIYAKYGQDMFTRWTNSTLGEVATEISGIAGFSTTTAKQFASGIKPFLAFMKRNAKKIRIKEKEEVKLSSNSLQGISVLWSKIRQHSVEPLITANGGEVLSSFRKGCTYLVCPVGENSTKIDKARASGTKIITPDELLKILRTKGIKV